MTELDRCGLAGNTVVIFLSDHGAHFGEHGLSAKWSPYDPSLQIPFIVADPRWKQTAGTTSDALVHNLNVATAEIGGHDENDVRFRVVAIEGATPHIMAGTSK